MRRRRKLPSGSAGWVQVQKGQVYIKLKKAANEPKNKAKAQTNQHMDGRGWVSPGGAG